MLKLLEEMLRKKAKTLTAEYRDHVQQMRSRPDPLSVELVRSSDTSWLEASAVRPAVEFLLQSGFQEAGVFAVKGRDKAFGAGFTAPQHGVHATVARNIDRAMVGFVSHFADGTAFDCSNVPVPFEPPCPDWLMKRRYTDASTADLWSRFLTERPSKPLLPATAESFAKSNLDDVAQYQAWMAERGGATRDELAAGFKAAGKLPAGAEAERFLDMARNDEVDRSLCNWWRLQSDAPHPLKQVIESLIIVHDDLSPYWLINAYWCGTDDFKVEDSDFARGSAREAFARVVADRGGLLHKIFEKRTPLAADFYLPK